MTQKSNTESLEIRYEPYVLELREFFKHHGLSYGEPDNILQLTEGISVAGPVQEEMTSMVRSIIFREHKAIPRTELLELIVVAIGGAHVDEAAQQIHEPVRVLHEYLVGVMRSLRRNAVMEELPAVEGEGFAGQEPAQTLDARDVSPHVEPLEDLPRAEEWDNRVSPQWDHEPRFEGGSAEMPYAGESSQHEAYGASFEPVAERASLLAIAPAAVEPSRSRSGWAYLGVLLVGLCLGLVWHRHASKSQVQVNGGHPVAAVATPAVSGTSPASLTGTAPTSLTAPEVQQNGTFATPGGVAGAGSGSGVRSGAQTGLAFEGPVDRHGVPAAGASGVVSAEPTAGNNRESAAAARGGEISPAAGGPAREQTSGRTARVAGSGATASPLLASIGKPGSFLVSSGLMADHLVSARAPKYPKMAAMAGVEGQVVLQAIVSKNGNVVATHVLDGHHVLRGAAIDAVRGWRYRPYRVHGRPTDVSTVVIVDVRSHH